MPVYKDICYQSHVICHVTSLMPNYCAMTTKVGHTHVNAVYMVVIVLTCDMLGVGLISVTAIGCVAYLKYSKCVTFRCSFNMAPLTQPPPRVPRLPLLNISRLIARPGVW